MHFLYFVTKSWFIRFLCSVLPEKTTIMQTELIYEKVCGLLMNGKRIRCRQTDFEKICEESGISRMTMDNIFYERLGLSGEEVLMHLRHGKVGSGC